MTTFSTGCYVFLRTAGVWAQQAYLKASDTGASDNFGRSVAVSGDTAVVGAEFEESCTKGVDGDDSDNLCGNAGAAYVFLRTGGGWAQQAYLKASNTDISDNFGQSVSVSGDTVVVGAGAEDSCTKGVDGDDSDNLCVNAGAAYVFLRTAGVWAQETYLKASNAGGSDLFGTSVSVSGDTAVVGATNERSCDNVIDGDETSNACGGAGAAYVFALPPGIISDPTGDTANAEIDIESADVTDDGTTLSCILKVATTDGLLNKSTFRCHIDFDDEENSDFAGKGCDLAASTAYRLGTNSLCTTSDITLTYRIGKRGGSCTGLPSVMCSELETDDEDDTDELCDGEVESDAAVSCTITLTASLDDIADVRDAQCSAGECLTDKDGTTGEYEAYGFFDSQIKRDRDRVLDTDDNKKPNDVGEVTTLNLIDPTLP